MRRHRQKKRARIWGDDADNTHACSAGDETGGEHWKRAYLLEATLKLGNIALKVMQLTVQGGKLILESFNLSLPLYFEFLLGGGWIPGCGWCLLLLELQLFLVGKPRVLHPCIILGVVAEKRLKVIARGPPEGPAGTQRRLETVRDPLLDLFALLLAVLLRDGAANENPSRSAHTTRKAPPGCRASDSPPDNRPRGHVVVLVASRCGPVPGGMDTFFFSFEGYPSLPPLPPRTLTDRPEAIP